MNDASYLIGRCRDYDYRAGRILSIESLLALSQLCSFFGKTDLVKLQGLLKDRKAVKLIIHNLVKEEAVTHKEFHLIGVDLQEFLGDILNLLVGPGYLLTAILKGLRVDVLLEKFPPELERRVSRDVLQKLISQEVPLILEDVDYIERARHLHISVMLSLEGLFNGHLASKDDKSVLKCRLTHLLAPHYLKNCLELVTQLHSLHK